MAKNDRDLLKEVSLEIAQRLSEVGPTAGIAPLEELSVDALGIESENTDGWSAKVGHIQLFGAEEVELAVWFDHWTGQQKRRFYSGFGGSVRAVQTIVDAAREPYLPQQTITNRDVEDDSYMKLRAGLPDHLFGYPVHERISGEGYFGIYMQGQPEALTQSACDFFIACSEAALEAVAVSDYPGVKERRLVKLHKSYDFVRNRQIAEDRKRFDKYTCQVCKLRFEDRYGELGRNYAEAHHIVPLHKLDDVVETRLEDLITVCANCHRMLHRMEGKEGDWETLRQELRPQLERSLPV